MGAFFARREAKHYPLAVSLGSSEGHGERVEAQSWLTNQIKIRGN